MATLLISDMRLGRPVALAVSVLLMTACRTPLTASAPVVSPQSTATVAGSTSPSASPAPTLYLPPAPIQPPDVASSGRTSSPSPVAAESCLVPFSNMSEADGGFITYPGGQRQDDPSSSVALPGRTPGQVGVNPGLAYDRVMGRWVPVPLDWLAPGGLTYAYMDFSTGSFGTGKLRAVTVADGSSGDVTTEIGWELIATADDGVYAIRANTPGAWFVPFGQAPRQIVDHGQWLKFSHGALWGIDSSHQVVQHDVTSGSETEWGTVSRVADIAGFATSGEPLVVTGGTLVMLHLNGSPTTLWPGTGGLGEGGRAYSDALGVWFEVDGASFGGPGTGVYLWTPAKGAQLVASEAVHVMGGCG